MTDIELTGEPHRISRVPGHDVATVTVRLTGSVVRALLLRGGELERNAGVKLKTLGIVAGLGMRCGPDTFSVALEDGFTTELAVTADTLGDPPDGDIPVTAHALDDGGWA